MIAAKRAKFAARLVAMREKLCFLHGNYRLVLAWPVAAIILGAAGWYFLLSDLNMDRETMEKRALREVAILADSYANQLTRTIGAIDQVALHVRYDWELTTGQLKLDNAKAQGLFPPSSIFAVLIVDRDNHVLTGTLPNPTEMYLGNTEYFLAQKNATKDVLHIGQPRFGRVSERNTIVFSRKLINRDGSFGGAVLVSVALGYFTDTYNEATFGKNGFLGMVGHDNIARVTRIGEVIHAPDKQALVAVPPVSFRVKSALLNGDQWFADKRNRYVGWVAVEGYPVTAMAGLDQQDVMAPYLAYRAASIQDGILATLALAAFALIATALSLRLAWRKHQHDVMQTTYRTATEGANEAFYITRPIRDEHGDSIDFAVIDCNQRGAEFFHRRREELIGKRISTLFQEPARTELMAILRQAMEAGYYEGELEAPEDFVIRWTHMKIVRSGADLAVSARDITEPKMHVAEMQRRGNEDALTGLPNRHWVESTLPLIIERAAASDSMLALLFIDLDGFKAVNDSAGHAGGDEVLRNVARRLRDAVRPRDTVTRFGGDEFVVILEQLAHKADAATVSERIQHAFLDAFRVAQGTHSVGASIGISVYPADGSEAQTLLRNADVAMYAVKTSGKRNYRFYDDQFYETLRARREKEAALRHAIEHDQFVMHYQPRVDMASGATSSMEALVRWEHPERGLISPLEFIPLAEETGLILGLGEMVIDKVCAQLACWAQGGQQLIPVSVNVSSRQFNETNVADILAAALARHHVDSALIEVELTESSVMSGSTDVASALAAIQRMGIKLLVDDFGTGYSSLSRLQRLEFDGLKVDQTFTAHLERTEDGEIFFRAIITMAHALGMRVVAEGVETLAQIQILKSLGCDEIQGFYLSRPLPSSAMQPILPVRIFA